MRDVIVASDELIASAGYLADRISVNLEQENKIFEEQGVEAYEAYQVAHENENLQKRKGVYPLMKYFSLVGLARQKYLQHLVHISFLMIRIYIQNPLRRLFRRQQCLIGMEIIRKSKTLYRAKFHL